MAVLVCGGAGYIGSHINKQLHIEGYETVVFDNLVYGHREAVKWGYFEQGDLGHIEEIESVFEKYTSTKQVVLSIFFCKQDVNRPVVLV